MSNRALKTYLPLYLLQHSSDKARSIDGVSDFDPAVDFMIVDMPEGLHVPTISGGRRPIPEWNVWEENYLCPVFDFAQEYLHDTAALVLIYPASSLAHRSHILGCCEEYKFRILETYLGSNHLHLTSAADKKKTVHLDTLICIHLYDYVIPFKYIEIVGFADSEVFDLLACTKFWA